MKPYLIWSVSLILGSFRMNFVSTSCNVHLTKMEFLENKHHMQAFLTLAESKVKSWIIKYGRHESVELILQNYIVSTDLDFFQKHFKKQAKHFKYSINIWLTPFIHHCHCCIFSWSVICREGTFLWKIWVIAPVLETFCRGLGQCWQLGWVEHFLHICALCLLKKTALWNRILLRIQSLDRSSDRSTYS